MSVFFLFSHLSNEKENVEIYIQTNNLKEKFWRHHDVSYKLDSWVLIKVEQKIFFGVLKFVKTPRGYGANFKSAINKKD